MIAPMDAGTLLKSLVSGRPLTEAEAEGAFELVLAGGLDAAQLGAMLAMLQARGPTVDELVGAARVMRRHATPVETPRDGVPVLDTCGTGGARKTFNVSTGAAIVAAAAGAGRLRVAKHGNRSRTGRGSAEVLEALGVNVHATAQVQARCLRGVGVCFSFAVNHHPAARVAAPVRASLGFPTIFNLVGPLVNPAGADRQVMGVMSARWVEPMAQALARLGAERAWVLHSEDGLDEISLNAPTSVAEVGDRGAAGRVNRWTVRPEDLGVAPCAAGAIEATTLGEAAAMVRGAIDGSLDGPRRCVELNAGAALVVGGVAADLVTGVGLARETVASGAALRTLVDLARLSQGG